MAIGQDANWNLLNYHLYNGFAALHGRLDRDLLVRVDGVLAPGWREGQGSALDPPKARLWKPLDKRILKAEP